MHRLQNISWRAFHVWRRNAEVLFSTWYTNLLPPMLEPVFYVLAFGLGVGSLIGQFEYREESMPFVRFVAPGVISVAVMFWSFFETTYSSFVRMYYQRTFDAMIATPLLVEDVIAGELLWGTTKAVGASTLMLLVLGLFGLIQWPTGLLVIPVAVAGGLMFSALGLIVTALSPKIEAFNLPIFLFVFPMFLFSGTFFPLEQLPGWALKVAWALPLTHACHLIRAACLGFVPETVAWHVTYIALAATGLGVLALKLMCRRLIK